ncbi:hypothetical protein SBADM41S_04291 [Streptomyces badius]
MRNDRPNRVRQGPSRVAARSGRPAASACPTSESAPRRTNSSSSGQDRSSQVTPWSDAAVTSRHSSAQPRSVRARNTARCGASATNAPPREGAVRCRFTGPGSDAGMPGTARSTPNSGRIPASAHALAKRTAPARESRSVSARASRPRSAARSASADGWLAPYRSE